MNSWLKKLLVLALIVCAFLFASSLTGEQGYVLISFANWTIEGSVFQVIAALIIIAVAIYVVVKLIQYLFLMLIWPSKWWQKFHAKKSTSFYQNGLNLMSLGQWDLAAEEFLKVRRTDRIESAKALSLVCAAHANNETVTKNVQEKLKLSNLDDANNLTFDKSNVPFSQLVLACQSKDYQQAEQLLNTLSTPVLKQTIAFQQLWLEVNIYQHNWKEVDELLPKLNKQIKKQSSEPVFEAWQTQLTTWFERGFSSFVAQKSLNQLEQSWQGLHKSNRQLPALLFAYLSALSKAQQSDKVESLILEQKKVLNNKFILNIIRRYYQLNHSVQMDILFGRVQKHLVNSPDDKELLTLLGYLAAGQRDHQLAKQALQKVVYSQNNATDTKLFAQELALLGETQKSLEVYHSL